MTAEKRLIEKKIEELNDAMVADEIMGCGCMPPKAYEAYYEMIRPLEERLAELRHYSSVAEMLADDRWMKNSLICNDDLPF